MKIDVLTLFPEMFVPVTESSILGKAVEKKVLDIRVTDIRAYSEDKHSKADDYPFGGGIGMVMMAQPIFAALEAIGAGGKKIVYMSPRGRILDEKTIRRMSELDELVILCGHYEGVDQRVIDCWGMEEVSIGDYILTGGELPAMVLIDSIARFVPGVLGTRESAQEESIYSGLLECDQYTKPREFQGLEVPEVLYSGNHKAIELWQFENSLKLTRARRPDLFQRFTAERGASLTKEEKRILQTVAAARDDENSDV